MLNLNKKHSFYLICNVILLFGLMAFLALPVQAAAYSDLDGHWAQDRIERWSDSGILSGYDDGTFGPDNPISRAELSSILYRLMSLQPIDHNSQYSDLSSDQWYYHSLSTMHTLGIALNTGDHIYPNQALTREEAVYMIAKAFFIGEDKVDRSALESISDGAQIEDRFSNRVGKMIEESYISGYPDGSFGPNKSITRAEVITIIDQIVDLYISKPGTYSIDKGKTALVTCGDVILTGGGDHSTVYLMGKATEGSVTLRGTDFCIYSAGQTAPQWKTEGSASASLQSSIELSTVNLPDTRFSGGTGQLASPYVISTPEQLRILGYPTIYETDAYYCLDRDIDLGELTAPIGSRNANSAMVWLDGAGHTITYNMAHSTRGPNYGLFQQWFGECSNLVLVGTVNVTFVPDGGSLKPSVHQLAYGGWAGQQYGGAYRNVQCNIDITVNGGDCFHMPVGGLTGTSSGVLFENCTAAGQITTSFEVVGSSITWANTGGLSGDSYLDTWTGCIASGTVQSNSSGAGLSVSELTAGGLAGRAKDASVSNCIFSGTVNSSSTDAEAQIGAGGLVGNGYDNMLFFNCGASGTASAQGGNHSNAGGLAAFLSFTYKADHFLPPDPASDDFEDKVAVIQNCWSTAALSASGSSFQSDCGGLAGQLSPAIIRTSWAKPTVTIKGPTYQNIGGITGSCYYNSIIEDCWANAQGCSVEGSLRTGGIVARVSDGMIANCYTLGTEKLSPKNAIAFADWNDGTISSCADLGRASQSERNQFYRSCGWDFSKIWDKNQTYPTLRDCDTANQLAAQS
ncbi:hypothetical protein N510_001779 [Firmicutes bacterium ASF500]|nr:hypothetical protein N510_001779 [Firmicutes bacterium ASF500]